MPMVIVAIDDPLLRMVSQWSQVSYWYVPSHYYLGPRTWANKRRRADTCSR